VKQQLLTPEEEKAIVDHVLRSSCNGFPVPVKILPHLAAVVLHKRSSMHQTACTYPARTGTRFLQAPSKLEASSSQSIRLEAT